MQQNGALSSLDADILLQDHRNSDCPMELTAPSCWQAQSGVADVAHMIGKWKKQSLIAPLADSSYFGGLGAHADWQDGECCYAALIRKVIRGKKAG